jgi:hypothetical protein
MYGARFLICAHDPGRNENVVARSIESIALFGPGAKSQMREQVTRRLRGLIKPPVPVASPEKQRDVRKTTSAPPSSDDFCAAAL